MNLTCKAMRALSQDEQRLLRKALEALHKEVLSLRAEHHAARREVVHLAELRSVVQAESLHRKQQVHVHVHVLRTVRPRRPSEGNFHAQALALDAEAKQSCVESKHLEQDCQLLHREEGVAARYIRELGQQIKTIQRHSSDCSLRHKGLMSSAALQRHQLQV